MQRLAIITTHPIQYYAPVFRLLAERRELDIKVFYTWEKGAADFDSDFGRKVEWDIPLLEGYDYMFVPNRGNASRRFFAVRNPSLNAQLEEWAADAILVIGWNYYSHLRAMRHFKGRIPVYFRGDSTLLDEVPGARTNARRVFLKWVYRHVDMAFYVGTDNKAYFERHGLAENQLVFTPHAIDNNRFADPGGEYTAAADRLRKELGIGERDTVVLFAGKFQAKKDPLLLLHSFIEAATPGTQLVMAGSGELEAAMRDVAAGRPDIHILPFYNQRSMPVLYRVGDLFCLPSQGPGETWGLAINEAMACGKPVIASDKCGAAADLVKEQDSGWVFAAGNADQLKQQLTRALQPGGRKMLGAMGKKAQELIKNWSFTHIAAGIETAVNGNPVHPQQASANSWQI